MPLLEVPKTFLEDLRRYDPALRCRWSDVRQAFLIERKVSRGKGFPPPAMIDTADPECRITTQEAEQYNREAWDDWVAANDGYTNVMQVERECLDNRVLFTLWQGDIWRQGGADVVNERIDRVQAEIRRESRADFNDRNREIGKDCWRYVNTVRTVPERFAHTAPVGGMSISD